MVSAFECRTLLVSASPLPCLRALDKPGIAVCDVQSTLSGALSALSSLHPHAVVISHEEPGWGAFLPAVCQQLPACPPRIITCFDTAGADAACLSIAEMPNVLLRELQKPCGILSAASMPARMACASRLLQEIGMPAHMKGYHCLVPALAWLSAFPAPAQPVRQGIYQQLAAHLCISSAAVERRIRSAIEHTWLSGNLTAQSTLFGLSVSAERGKPTNAEFLFTLSEHLRQRLYG